jgi:putative ABC transport system permease protein
MFKDSIKLALGNIGRTKLRHFLTMCGIMIGTGAIVSMVSYTVGMRNEMSRTIASSGLLTTIYVLPSGGAFAHFAPGMDEHDPDDSWTDSGTGSANGSGADSRAADALISGSSDSSRRPQFEATSPDSKARETQVNDDVIARIGSIKGVTSAFPLVAFPAIVSRDSKQVFVTVTGIPSAMGEAIKRRLEKGKVFSSEDDSTLLASTSLAKRLGVNADSVKIATLKTGIPVTMTIVTFGGGSLAQGVITGRSPAGTSFSPLTAFGMQMPFGRRTFRFYLKGVLKESFFGPIGRADCYIPLKMAKGMAAMTIQDPAAILKNPSLGRGGYLGAEVHVANLSDVDGVTQRIRAMNLAALSISDQLKGMRTALMLVSAFLGAIGGVALFVGCLGIVNVMLISVFERTREIGIMKSVGARRKDILTLFVAEAGIIGLVGGLLGILLGWLVAEVTNHVMFAFVIKDQTPFRRLYEIPFWLAAGAVGLAIMVSIIAGLYPARRAAGLEPTAALRYE